MRKGIFIFWAVAVLLGSLFWLGQAASQEPKTPPPSTEIKTTPKFSSFISLATNKEVIQILEALNSDIKDGNSDELTALNYLLKMPEDCFIPVEQKNADGKTSIQWVSARMEANHLLKELPAEFHKKYQKKFGHYADVQLEKALDENDLHQFAKIGRQFLHTKAGMKALDYLGTYHLDRGSPLMAASCFEKLLNSREPKQIPPMILFKAALAYQRNGQAPKAETVWKHLAASSPNGLQIGDNVLSLKQLKNLLQKQPKALTSASTDWPMLRGAPDRQEEFSFSAASVKGDWHHDLVQETFARDWLKKTETALAQKGQTIIPGSVPVAHKGKIFCRTQRGVLAIDQKTGDILWESATMFGGLDTLTDSANYGHVSSWVNEYLEKNPSLMVENNLTGTLSSDANHVYAVEDLTLPPFCATYGRIMFISQPPLLNNLSLNFAPELSAALHHNRLWALDQQTGKIVWVQGGRSDPAESPLHNAYFLGPPLPVDGNLYALIEQDYDLKLVCLNPHNGKLQWKQTLATYNGKLIQEGGRRTWAAPLAHADGILVCPTNSGAVIAVDLLGGDLLWAYAYSEEPPPPPPPAFPVNKWKLNKGSLPQVPPIKLEAVWKMAAPIIVDGKVLINAPDEDSIHCLSLQDGKLLWKMTPQNGDVFLAGVSQDRVFIAGQNQFRALALSSGRPLWTCGTGIPCGLGVMADGKYYLPARYPDSSRTAIQVIDLKDGSLLARHPAASGRALGNIVLHRGQVVMQTATGITGWELKK